MDITEFKNKTLTVSDEWDTDRIIEENVLPYKRLMIRGFVAGTGRSHICKKMIDRGHKVLFVVPTNELGQECGCEWTTLNKFFGIAFGDEKIMKFDSSEFDVIVFDEIYFHNVGKWALIREYERNNPEKIIIATGDTKQLKNPESISNTIPFEQYADYCINQIFKYNIMLYESKRLKTEEDRKKLLDVRKLCFESDISFKKNIDKYFKWTDEIKLFDNNIAYRNETCKKVSQKIREMKNIDDEYIVGEEVVCRKFFKTDEGKCNVIFKYRIADIKGEKVKLIHTNTGDTRNIDINILRKYFIYAYCYTAHSKQGCSVDSDIVIYDWNFRYACRNWFYTSLTRARNLNRVWFYRYPESDDDLLKDLVGNYLRNRIKSYKNQDAKAGREIESDEYIDEQWLMGLINTKY